MGVSFISACSPALVALPCRCGLASEAGVPGNCSGSVGKRGATTLAIEQSLSGAWTMGQSVCRALTADSTATRNIQGAKGNDWIHLVTLHKNTQTDW